jgi:hypothetical protein
LLFGLKEAYQWWRRWPRRLDFVSEAFFTVHVLLLYKSSLIRIQGKIMYIEIAKVP